MKILQINQTFNIGSTGKIMADLNNVINNNGHKGYMLCAYSLEDKKNLYVMDEGSYPANCKKNILRMRITGLNGYTKKNDTIKALEWIDKIAPDVIHIHNIHGDWINLELLFNYFKDKNIKLIWTLHDCWSFTGRCSHFEICGCQKWKRGCNKCKNKKVYPITYYLDFSNKMYQDKKNWFTKLENINIITPSEWLLNYVKKSYLSKYKISVINNGIDTTIFKYSSKRSKYLHDIKKEIILGVANSWSNTKGYNDFIQLSKMLDSNKYQIVMVGLNQRQIKKLPENILGIGRTQNIDELVELYSNAKYFLNLTYQDNYPTTNLESLACGTPVITYNTGGSPESIFGPNSFVVNKGELNRVKELIESSIMCELEKRKLSKISASIFSKENCFSKYLNLYENIIGEK